LVLAIDSEQRRGTYPFSDDHQTVHCSDALGLLPRDVAVLKERELVPPGLLPAQPRLHDPRMVDVGVPRLEIGGRIWRVVVGSGHSPEHACLHQPELKVFIAGDQVLPKISSNVSVFPTEPDADPLGDWMASLNTLKREVPDEVLVLPSHGRPFRGLHARLDALAEGHRIALGRLERSLAEPKRAVDVFGALFARRIEGGLLGMATGESLAHLNRLVREGRAWRETGADGVWRWRRA